MRNKLAFTIALAVLAGVLLLGLLGGGSASGAGTTTTTGTTTTSSTTTTTPGAVGTTTSPPVCADGIDNDGDGLIDSNDPDCTTSGGTSEATPTTPPPTTTTTTPSTTTTTPTTPGTTTTPGGSTSIKVVPSPKGGKHGGANGETGGVGPGKPKHQGKGQQRKNKSTQPPPPYKSNGTPTVANPSATIAPFGPAPLGVPNIVIDQFEIPPFLLPIYQACGTQYDIPWQVLAGINKIETAFGTNLNVSSAGAVGWMQFLPSTWKAYGIDANGDRRKDPYNPVDAICAAARYLRAAGGSNDLRRAIFAYNHADWYVDEVLLFARGYGRIPQDLLGSLTGLTEGAHFPIAANARYADDISARQALHDSETARKQYGNAAKVIESSPTRRGINIFSRRGAPVVAVNDGVIRKIGNSPRLGRFIVLQDAYGNRFTYAGLGTVVRKHPVPKPAKLTAADFKLVSPPKDKAPSGPATVGAGAAGKSSAHKATGHNGSSAHAEGTPHKRHVRRSRLRSGAGPAATDHGSGRTLGARNATPRRKHADHHASLGRQLDALAGRKLPGYTTFRNYFKDVLGLNRKDAKLVRLRKGSKVVGGTVLGSVGRSANGAAPHINFAIRPAGRGAPRIDPKPILDGWKLLEATAIYRAAGRNPFASNLGVGGVLLMSKEALIRRVLADPRLEIYSCGRTDIQTGQIDRRVLAGMEYLVEKGFRLTITSLKCGHSFLTSSGNVSEHSTGDAMDIAAINGVPVIGHQGPGTLSAALIQTLLQLQGTEAPHQIISLMDFPGPQSFALPDHYDHVHVGWQPLYSNSKLERQFNSLLKPGQWQRLIERLGQIQNPSVPVKPSKYSLPSGKKRSSKAHKGD
jgi:Transglycosylase SLT domain